MAARVQDHPIVQCLLTIPGVSLITAATIDAYLGDPRRFRGPKQVKRDAGLDPSVYQSGQRNRRGRTSKHGCTALRAALIEAAQTTVRWGDGPLGSLPTAPEEEGSLRERGGGGGAAVGHRLANDAYGRALSR
ncbi:IS110 family transposase [Thermaerobacter composti]|uniref:IS110 family transposase n=1 Tax=Thermaerobacter composti TaxID=554949 RepID=A0ABZ0QPK5_9FIRM|nr:IS110 family transposase [Thermaerobacter composti]